MPILNANGGIYRGLTAVTLPSGTVIYRVRPRRNHLKRIQIHGTPGTPEFDKAYTIARAGQKPPLMNTVENRLRSSGDLMENLQKMINMAKARSREKGLEFALRKADLLDCLERQDWVCAVSKREFDISPANGKRRNLAMSIDRIDNTKGYTRDNIRITTVMVNMARLNWADEDFMKMCVAVALGAAA